MRTRTILVSLLLAITGTALSGCHDLMHDDEVLGSPAPCRAHTPADPLVLSWTENIDDMFATAVGLAGPALEITADGRVVADAVEQTRLSPSALRYLLEQLRTDLAGAGPGPGR